MTGLGHLPGASGSTARLVSADGVVVLGDAANANGSGEVFIWSSTFGMRSLRDELRDRYDLADELQEWYWYAGGVIGISADRTVLAGYAYPHGVRTAFRLVLDKPID